MRFSQLLMIIWLIVPLSVGLLFVLRKTRVTFWKPFVISIALGYVLFVAAAQIGDRELKARLYELDTNGDGNFTDSEITPEVEERIRDVSSDTEKVLAPFTGVPLSAVWTSINLGVIFLIRAIVLGHKSRKCLSERST